MKPLSNKPSYLTGKTARKAQAGTGHSAHPDYFSPDPDTEYHVVFLPAHPNYPKDENGDPVPFAVVERYYGGYKTPSDDVRRYPVASDELKREGRDPLYQRHLTLNDSDDEKERSVGWRLRPSPRIIINVWVVDSRDKNGVRKKGKDLGDLYMRPHLLELPSKTFFEKVAPLFESGDFDRDAFYDLFGQFEDSVPAISVKKHKKGDKAWEIEWLFSRLDNKVVNATKNERYAKMREQVIDAYAHETNLPHTAEELNEIMALSVAEEIQRGRSRDTDFEGSDEDFAGADSSDDDFLGSDESTSVPEKEDSSEEIKPVKAKAKPKPKPKPEPKKEPDFSKEDDDFGGAGDDGDDGDDFI